VNIKFIAASKPACGEGIRTPCFAAAQDGFNARLAMKRTRVNALWRAKRLLEDRPALLKRAAMALFVDISSVGAQFVVATLRSLR
jgi:hypothetical protein